MPKLKTKKALSKRVKITKKGKAVRSKAGKSHLLSSKNRKRKRGLRKQGEIAAVDMKMVKKALPYAF